MESLQFNFEEVAPLAWPNVLVVDDHQPTADALARLLEAERYQTAVAYRAAHALSAIDEFRFQAAVVDLNLPDLHGLILIQKLRERLGPKAPVIVLSGENSIDMLKAVAQSGATYFFSKPVNVSQLLTQLRACLNDAGASN